MANLSPWAPTDNLAAPMVDLVQDAEAATIAELEGSEGREWGAIAVALDALLWARMANPRVNAVASSVGERARAAADEHWAAQVGRAVGREVALDTGPTRELLAAWVAENTARIQGLRNEAVERMRQDILDAQVRGLTPVQLAEQWRRDGIPTTNGRLRGRATVIARDQLGKLAGRIAEAQQRAMGITAYTWDERFGIRRKRRALHRGRHGEVYRWDSPPDGGHPGHAISCYCRAVAVVSDERLRELGRR